MHPFLLVLRDRSPTGQPLYAGNHYMRKYGMLPSANEASVPEQLKRNPEKLSNIVKLTLLSSVYGHCLVCIISY